ncbi:MAG: DinB family protein [Blastocatellia bacterium]
MVQQLFFSVEETVSQLEGTLTMIEWIAARVPEPWHHRTPEGAVRGLKGDERTVAFHLSHLTLYETKLAIPVLDDLSKGGDGRGAVPSAHVSWFRPDVDQLSLAPVSDILAQLRSARVQHVEIVRRFNDEAFNRPATSLWGTGDGQKLESAGWVAVKTVQHTGEHANSLFRFALFAP